MWAEISEAVNSISRRRLIFIYDLILIAVLLLIGVLCIQTDHFKGITFYGFSFALVNQYKILFNCMWLGAMGGLTISLKGVYDHGNPLDPWHDAFNLWHIGRPVSGAIAGLIAALLFILIVPADKFSSIVLYGVAFIFGMQDRAFFDFLSTFAGRFLPKSDQPGSVGVRISAVSPASAIPGTIVTIQGQGFEPDAIVKVGSQALNHPTFTPDGTAVSGPVLRLPEVATGASQPVDVIVVNKSGSSAALVGKLSYGPQPPP